MILVMDIGNTNIKIGIFDKDQLKTSWRLSVTMPRTADEYFIDITSLFASQNLKINCIDGIIISSVVPTLNYTVEHMCTYYFKMKPIFVSSEIETGITFGYDNPRDIGADRIVNAVAVCNLYTVPCIVVDLGTATTLGVIDRNGCFLGGAIAPGLKTSIEGLARNAALLQRIELQKPKNAIGRNTIENMQIGAVNGFVGLISNIIKNFKRELGEDDVLVVGTGGLTELVDSEDYKIFDVIDRALTLKGLYILYKLNKNK